MRTIREVREHTEQCLESERALGISRRSNVYRNLNCFLNNSRQACGYFQEYLKHLSFRMGRI